MKQTGERSFKCKPCNTACFCNFDWKEPKQKIKGKKHSSAISATLLFVIILIWKKMMKETYRGKIVQVQTMQHCLLLEYWFTRKWRIKEAGKKHSSTQSAKLLFVVILIWKKLKNETYRRKAFYCTPWKTACFCNFD